MKLGDPVPDISASTTLGQPFRLADHRGKYVVLYFFPKAFTPGCTRETEQFRDQYPEITALGAQVVGVSTDSHEVQCDFANTMKVPFPMIGDADGKIVAAYGVKWPLLKLSQRVTVLVDPEGRLAGYFHHELAISKHADEVVSHLKRAAQQG
jgi:thioredoxin-dependent peroxiredoxin